VRRALPVLIALTALLAGLATMAEAIGPPGPIRRSLFVIGGLLWWVGGAWVAGLLALPERRRELLLAAAAAGLALVAAEAGLRITEHPLGLPRLGGMADPDWHHALPPNRTMLSRSWDDRTARVVRTNEHGLRSTRSAREFAAAPGPRVLVLGDSFVFGLGVGDNETMPARLEHHLRQRPGWEEATVMNAAVASWSPIIHRRVLEDLIAHYRPNVVVQVLDATDLGDDHRYARELVDGRFFVPAGRPPASRPAVWHLATPLRKAMRRPLRRWRQGDARYAWERFEVEVAGVVETNRFFHWRHPAEATEPWLIATRDHVRATMRVGGGGLVVLAPRYPAWDSQGSPHDWERDQHGDAEHRDAWRRWFAAQDVRAPVFDLEEGLAAAAADAPGTLTFQADPHWTPAGCDAVAKLLAAQLTAP